MKKIGFVIVTLFCIFNLFADWQSLKNSSTLFDVNDNSSENFTEFTFELNGYDTSIIQENGMNYTKISHPQGGEFLNIGMPDLPIFTTFIEIPAEGMPIMQIVDSKQNTVNNITIYPRQPLQSESIIQKHQFTIDTDYYENGSKHSEIFAQIGDPFIMRDLRIVPVTVIPFSYDPVEQTLSIITSMKIQIHTDGTGGKNTKQRSRLLSPSFDPLYKATVLNYDSRHDRDEFQKPTYLFISPNSSQVMSYLPVLTDWKREKGFNVVSETTLATGTSLTSIKNFIQNAYDTWENPPEFVCLVGDAGGSFNIPTGHMDGGSYDGEGDHFYTELEGNDMIADVFIGRLSFNSITEFQTIISKIINYEKEPYTDNTEWFNHSVVVGDPTASGPSTVDTKIYVENMMNMYAPNIDVTEVFSGSWTTNITNNINAGSLFFNYRGFGGMSGWTTSHINSLNNGFMLPVATALTCNTGDFEGTWDSISEAFLKAGSPTSPKGAIAAISTATGNTHTCFNNCVDSGIYQGIFPEKLYNMGAALARGKLNLTLNYPQNPNNSIHKFSYWNNLMGDPGMEIWTGVPQQFNVSHQSVVDATGDYLQVSVQNPIGLPVKNAWVSLLDNGASDPKLVLTDNNGYAYVPLNDLNVGEAVLTVSFHNFIPYQSEILITESAPLITIDSVTLDEIVGNGDGIINPGESINLTITLLNNIGEDQENVILTCSSNSSFINLSQTEASFGTIISGTVMQAVAPISFDILPETPGNLPLYLDFIIASDSDDIWNDHLNYCIEGVDMAFLSYDVLDDDIIDPGETANIAVSLVNQGQITAQNAELILSCEDNRIDIINDTAMLGNINPDQNINNDNSPFTISVGSQINPGMQIPFSLNLMDETGVDQSMNFMLDIGNVTVTDPLGPDAYGYFCYDDGDLSYMDVPQYQWIETNPAEGGSGITLNIQDNGNTGAAVVVGLLIDFKFYGIPYDQLTICSNGWIAPGSTDNHSFMNWTIPGAPGPSPLIAPFWDDLVVMSDDVSYYNDPVNHWFVVQWNDVSNQYNGDPETFEVILYDYNYYPTMNGSSPIKFQYKEINNVDQGEYSWGVEHGQYATVGIENQLANTGLEYTFNNSYPTAAKMLEDEMAILFTGEPINQDEPFLVLNSILISGENGNNQLDYNETAQINLIINNLGNNDSGQLTATLTTNDTLLTILDDEISISNVPGNGSCETEAAFSVQVPADITDQYQSHCSIHFIGDDFEWDLEMNLILNAPKIMFQSILINDEDNQLLDPGETTDANIYFINNGHAPVESSTIQFSLDSEYIVLNEITAQFQNFNPGEIQYVTINMTASAETMIGYIDYINWALEGTGDYSANGTLPVVVAQVPVVFEENFDTFLPEGWEITGGNNWGMGDWGNAGGTPPEALFSWSPSCTGTQRLVSPPINTLGSMELELEFFSYVSHFSGTYSLMIQTYSGEQWHTVASFPAESDPAHIESITITSVDVGSENFQFAFVFDGNSYNINYWCVDNVYLTNGNSGTFGCLQGEVTLDGGDANVREVMISTGPNAVYPDTLGHYYLPLTVGLYDVTASLDGYGSVTISDIQIVPLNTVIQNFNLVYLAIPENLNGEVVENDVHLNWHNPEITRGLTLSRNAKLTNSNRELIGMKVYRDDVCISDTMHPGDSTFVDIDLPDGVYTYYVTASYDNGESDPSNIITLEVDYSDSPENQIPLITQLQGNYPNPFNPATEISFALQQDSPVSLIIYNIRGEKVKTLIDKEMKAAYHTILWEGLDDGNRKVASGIYFYVMKTDSYHASRKMLLLK